MIRVKMKDEIKLSKHRFLVLILYCLTNLHINSQWTQFQVIADIFRPYFGVTNTDIDWTVTIWCPIYLVMCFVSAYCLDKFGLRSCLLMASGFNLFGSAIKYYSIIYPDFLVACLGQSLVATGQVFNFFLPSSIALTWFPAEVASTITAIALFPMFFGNGLGYYLPSLAVPDGSSPSVQKMDLERFFLYYTLSASLLYFLNLFLLKNRPKYPSSLASAKALAENTEFIESWKVILTNRLSNFILITFTFLQTLANVVLGLLSPMISKYFPNQNILIGIIGAIASLSSVFGSLILAWVTDKTRKYKLVTLISSILMVPLFGLLIYSLEMGSKLFVTIVIALLCFLVAGTYPIGMDFIVQANYPMSESVCVTLMMFSNQLISWPATVLVSYLLQYYNLYYAFSPFLLMLLIALITVLFTKDQLNRDKANSDTENLIKVTD
ncbi:uncharacterized MFS-type transporter C09D4.1-like [Panonychus citri]|uniref:uncharacterized MFS-type transporter C09D4.1-like n=1 Tax=Panonychus citri TaxID=50023 RepID=UPI0023073139|nr:uncharacterized MFS-type transporter C09D4.1-like [Panonychus citri]